MTPEQEILNDYDKGTVEAGPCVDGILASIKNSHPNLYTLLADDCGDILTDEECIQVLREVLSPISVYECPQCETDAYGYMVDSTNEAECNHCGTFFKIDLPHTT